MPPKTALEDDETRPTPVIMKGRNAKQSVAFPIARLWQMHHTSARLEIPGVSLIQLDIAEDGW